MIQDNDDRKLSAKEHIIEYFTRLEFFREKRVLGGNAMEGLELKKLSWTLSVYLLASLGIFCRQITDFPKKVDMNLANFQWSIFFASLILGFALLPTIIKKVNRNTKKPGVEQILSAFGTGFFVDFTSNGVIHYYFK